MYHEMSQCYTGYYPDLKNTEKQDMKRQYGELQNLYQDFTNLILSVFKISAVIGHPLTPVEHVDPYRQCH